MLILIYLYVFSYKAFENSDRVVISYHRVDVVIRMYIYISIIVRLILSIYISKYAYTNERCDLNIFFY